MDVSQLKTLIHVAEVGSLSRAADRLHIAQPALSRQIRLLENELGVPLFERHGRGMVITEMGEEVLTHAARIMEELEAIRELTAKGSSSLRGLVSMGTPPTVAEIVTVPLVTRLQSDYNDLSIRLLSAFSGYLLDWLQRGELDLAVTYETTPLRTLRIHPVMNENLLLVSATDQTLALDRTVDFADLATMELILPSSKHVLRTIVDNCARQAGIVLKPKVEADSFGAMLSLVRNGTGATVLPLAPILPEVQSGQLFVANLANPAPSRNLALTFPADRPITPAARYVGKVFVDVVRDVVEANGSVGRMLTDDH